MTKTPADDYRVGGSPITVPSIDALTPVRFGLPFAVLVAVGTFYFAGIGMLAPVLPRYVVHELGGGGAEVGVVVGAFALSALLLRSWVGRIGDRRGRRVLVIGGCAVLGVSLFGYGVGGLAVLVLMRLLSGVGEAAAVVGAVTLAEDLAPPGRSGQAAGLFSISLSVGMIGGVPIGEWIYQQHGANLVFVVAGSLCLLAALAGAALPPWRPHVSDASAGSVDRKARPFLHPAALRPGVILACGVIGSAAFSAFVPLYVDDLGLASAGPVLVESSAIVLGLRLVASRLPDRLGTRRGPLVALALQASGMMTMAAWASPSGLYFSTAVYAVGSSFLYPSLLPGVAAAAPPSERSHAIGTFILFFDLPLSVGAPVLGLLVEASGERAAFFATGVVAAVGWFLHRSATTVRPVVATTSGSLPAA